ncbi:hypothetical protein TRFO_23251 [Tritrichomonas foetus]|uniref:EGF-like domain-containing protein n=1 Tax=Tritrichomonas foetus TaxID=1144522 RepID=A0A1J4KAK1_9EUKA|nr:hypothetical protein TRFO_23251 [Tritrichomonas foetus]|eukprot:OHT08251.1 hypothetical protein TRFO_23251 [Tritrichomonas foetus]
METVYYMFLLFFFFTFIFSIKEAPKHRKYDDDDDNDNNDVDNRNNQKNEDNPQDDQNDDVNDQNNEQDNDQNNDQIDNKKDEEANDEQDDKFDDEDNENNENQFIDMNDVEDQKEILRSRRRRRRFDPAPPFDNDPNAESEKGESKRNNRFFHRFQGDDQVSNEPCDRPHTKKDFAGRCVCKKGYMGNDPALTGCWKCNETCHANGFCHSPGVCKCMYGYRGDGVKHCEPIPPSIERISPEICENDGSPCVVNITFAHNFHMSKNAYCSFKGTIVQAVSLQRNVATCIVPDRVYGKAYVRLSFDAKLFSEDKVSIYVKGGGFFDFEHFAVAFMFLVVMATIVRVLYLQYREAMKPGRMNRRLEKLGSRRRKKRNLV